MLTLLITNALLTCDGCREVSQMSLWIVVIPAKAGIQTVRFAIVR
jgi:hypothetical protein